MRKKALVALALSVFGTGAALAKGCGESTCAWHGYSDCKPCAESDPEDRLGKDYIAGSCGLCDDYCVGYANIKSVSPVLKKAIEIVKEKNPKALKLRGGKALNVALEIAEINPRAAIMFLAIYVQSDKLKDYVPEESIIWGPDAPLDSPLTIERAKELILEYYSEGKYDKEKYVDKNSDIKYQYEWYLREVADGTAYIKMKISIMDKEQREVEKIRPDIRINLHRSGDEKEGYWEVIDWMIERN